MNIVTNIAAVLGGIILGSLMNMALIYLGPMIIPPPEGADMTTTEGLKAAMPLLQPVHFIFPFLAHSAGTLAGAFLVAKSAATHHKILVMVVALFFLMGGIMATTMIPAPMWYILLDLSLAYLPMGWLGWKLGRGF